MSLGDVIFQALTGYVPQSMPTDFDSATRDLVQLRQVDGLSRRAFARRYDIPESTLRRMEKGEVRTAKGRAHAYDRLSHVWTRAVLNESRAERWRNNQMSIRLDGFPSHGRTETRTLNAASLELAQGTGAAVVAAIERGDKRAAAKAFHDGITNAFYHDKVFAEWLDDDDLSGEGSGYDDASDYSMTVSAS